MKKQTPRTKAPQPIQHIPDADGFYTWDVRVRVHKTWVEDGFSLSNDENGHGVPVPVQSSLMRNVLGKWLSSAYGHEYSAEVLAGPPDECVRMEQGDRTLTKCGHHKAAYHESKS